MVTNFEVRTPIAQIFRVFPGISALSHTPVAPFNRSPFIPKHFKVKITDSSSDQIYFLIPIPAS